MIFPAGPQKKKPSRYKLGSGCQVLDGTVGAVAERATAALRVTGSIPAWNKYFYDLHLIVPGVTVCVPEFKCL